MSTEKIMEQAQVFASAWALVGGRFDSGDGMEIAELEKEGLRAMVETLKRERDELAAHNKILRDALEEQEAADRYSMHYAHLTEAEEDIAAAHEGAIAKRDAALSITPSAALREIGAQSKSAALEEAADYFEGQYTDSCPQQSISKMLRKMAAAKRKGE